MAGSDDERPGGERSDGAEQRRPGADPSVGGPQRPPHLDPQHRQHSARRLCLTTLRSHPKNRLHWFVADIRSAQTMKKRRNKSFEAWTCRASTEPEVRAEASWTGQPGSGACRPCPQPVLRAFLPRPPPRPLPLTRVILWHSKAYRNLGSSGTRLTGTRDRTLGPLIGTPTSRAVA